MITGTNNLSSGGSHRSGTTLLTKSYSQIRGTALKDTS